LPVIPAPVVVTAVITAVVVAAATSPPVIVPATAAATTTRAVGVATGALASKVAHLKEQTSGVGVG
jgi:hypothetical protein